MTENQFLCAMFAEGLIEREDVPLSCWHKPRKPKPPSLLRAIKLAKTKGMVLTVDPSGSMTFKTSSEFDDDVTKSGANGANANEWDRIQ